MSDGVTDFWNALHIDNKTGRDLSYTVKADGNKQLFSVSGPNRNVPNRGCSDEYNIAIPANGSFTIGGGIYRNGDFDQETHIEFVGLGKLNLSGTTQVHGGDISQVSFWSGASNVTAPTGVVWNFNNRTSPVLTLTIN